MVGVAGWAAMIFLVFPVILTVVVSFNGSFFIEFPPKSLSLEWYGNIAAIHRIGQATLISFGVALLSACSVVVAPVVVDGEHLGSVGVLGPTRMDYPQALATVDVVSEQLGHRIEEG